MNCFQLSILGRAILSLVTSADFVPTLTLLGYTFEIKMGRFGPAFLHLVHILVLLDLVTVRILVLSPPAHHFCHSRCCGQSELVEHSCGQLRLITTLYKAESLHESLLDS